MKKIIFNLVFVLFLLLSINKSYSDSKETFNFSFTETDFFVYSKGNNIKENFHFVGVIHHLLILKKFTKKV